MLAQTHTHTYTHTYTYKHTNTHTSSNTHMELFATKEPSMLISPNKHTHTHPHTYTCTHTRGAIRHQGTWYVNISEQTHTHTHTHTHIHTHTHKYTRECTHTRGVVRHQETWYGVATVSRIDKIRGLFCRILSLLKGSFVNQTYNLIDPTIRSHPICQYLHSAAFLFAKGQYRGFATISTLLEIIGLFCERAL